MPETLTQTVEVPAERVIEAAAMLLASQEESEFFTRAETKSGEAAGNASIELLRAATGAEGEAFWMHPLVVEAHARAYERVAAAVVAAYDYEAQARDVRERGHACWGAFH